MYTYDDVHARFYDIISTGISGDVQFYVEEAKKAGPPVLELGCGGLIATRRNIFLSSVAIKSRHSTEILIVVHSVTVASKYGLQVKPEKGKCTCD